MSVSPESERLLDAALPHLVEDYRYSPHPRRVLSWRGKKLVKQAVVSEGWTTRKNGMVMGADSRMVARGFICLLLRWREEGGV